MKSAPSSKLLPLLRELRRRHLVRSYQETLATMLLVAGGILVIVGAVRLWLAPAAEETWKLPVILLIGAAVLAAVWVAKSRLSLRGIAERVDRLGNTRDRLLTALALSERAAPPSNLEELARHECEEFLSRRDLRRLISIRPPKFAGWIAVPLIAWAVLTWQGHLSHLAFEAEKARAQAAIAGTRETIDLLARQAEKAAEQSRGEDLQKLAEQMRRSSERLSQQSNPEEARKEALRELSALSEMLKELQRQPAPAEEVKELAKALSSLPGMEDVLNALNEHDLAQAQRAMEQAMEKQNQNKPDASTEAQAEKQLQQAMQRLADQRRLSVALQKFADQMKQQAGGMSQQAMQQLQQMLQQMSRQGNQASSGSSEQQRRMSLQEMIAALESMKFGEGQANQGSESQDLKQGSQINIQSFGSTNPQGTPQTGNASLPSGRPGSEHDFGTTDTPFGGKTEPQEKGGELAIKGQLGQGESLSMKLPSVADNSKSARRTRELVEAAAASAEDAVQQENIPLGSRFLVKRYFESIRPKE